MVIEIETLSVLVYFYAVFTSIVIWKGLMCTVSSAMDQFPYLHTLHVTWKPALPLKKKLSESVQSMKKKKWTKPNFTTGRYDKDWSEGDDTLPEGWKMRIEKSSNTYQMLSQFGNVFRRMENEN